MLPTLIISRSGQGEPIPPSSGGRHRAPPGHRPGGRSGLTRVLVGVVVLAVGCLAGSAGINPAARSQLAAPPGIRRGPSGVDGGTAPTAAPPPGVTIAGGATVISGGTGVTVPVTGTGGTSTVSVGGKGIPGTVLAAYQEATARLAATEPDCHLPLALLAGIGEVESGQARGGAVDASGTARSPILGPVLDGTGGTTAIRDTDRGALDGDPVWDRAVGPMQFIPSTWRRWGADGNGDGRADPENVFDAALAAAGYLCAGGRDLATGSGVDAAILSYNNSTRYRQLVLAWMSAYGGAVVPLADATGLTAASANPGTGSGSVSGSGTTAGGAPVPTAPPVTQPAPGGGTVITPPAGAAAPPSTAVDPPGNPAPPVPPSGQPVPPTQAAPPGPLRPVVCGLTGVVGGLLGGLLGTPAQPDPDCPQGGTGG